MNDEPYCGMTRYEPCDYRLYDNICNFTGLCSYKEKENHFLKE